MSLLKFTTITIILIVGVVLFILVRNGANLLDEPGISKRLGVFFTLNSANTSDDPFFEELRTPVFDMDAEKLYQLTLEAISSLGWGIISHDSDKLNISFIVQSPVFLFEDDVFVQVNAIGFNQSSLFIQSSSRKGSADLAANSGHIQTLIKKLKALSAQ